MRRILAVSLCLLMVLNVVPVHAQGVEAMGLPVPGAMVGPSPVAHPAVIRGLTVDPKDPFLFNFIVDLGDSKLSGRALSDESQKLIKYFLATLALPEKDIWVNLSPVEKDRVITDTLAKTEMGQVMLAQDYILKQLAASYLYPEQEPGRSFWQKVYAEAQAKFGTTNVPVDTFNKVWITAEHAQVHEKGHTAFLMGMHLKVQLESDYLMSADGAQSDEQSEISKKVLREIVIPAIEKEVNEGTHFAPLRQIFSSMILAIWYKEALQGSLIDQVFADQSKVSGIDLADPQAREKLYARYMEAYRKGVFNYIKEEPAAAGEMASKKYFSGGITVSRQALERFRDTPTAAQTAGMAADAFVNVQAAMRTVEAPAAQTTEDLRPVTALPVLAADESIITIGAPGAGKGTALKAVAEDIYQVSTGDLIRAEIKANPDFRAKVDALRLKGDLVPDEDVMLLLKREVIAAHERGIKRFAFDGVPRKVEQAVELDAFLQSQGIKVGYVLFVNLPEKKAVARLLARGRSDDTEEAIANRFRLEQDNSRPIRDYYRALGELQVVDAGTPKGVLGGLLKKSVGIHGDGSYAREAGRWDRNRRAAERALARIQASGRYSAGQIRRVGTAIKVIIQTVRPATPVDTLVLDLLLSVESIPGDDKDPFGTPPDPEAFKEVLLFHLMQPGLDLPLPGERVRDEAGYLHGLGLSPEEVGGQAGALRTYLLGSDTLTVADFRDVGLAFALNGEAPSVEALEAIVGGYGGQASAAQVNGGIDLDRAHLKLVVDKDGRGVTMPVDQALIEHTRQGGLAGLVPVILSITPVTGKTFLQ